MGEYIYKSVEATLNIVSEDERIVEGYLGDDKVDIDGHFIPRDVYERAIRDFEPWGNIREMHANPVGSIISMGEKSWNHIVVKIVDDKAWNLVKNKVYKGFSIGARILGKEWVNAGTLSEDMFAGIPNIIRSAIMDAGKVLKITGMLLGEISVVDRPINPRALFTAYKGISDKNIQDMLPVLPEIYNAQEIYLKGVIQMEEQEITTQVDQVNSEEVEKTAGVEQAAPENTESATETVEDNVTNPGNNENDDEVKFDAEKAFNELQSHVNTALETIKGDMGTFQSSIDNIAKSLSEVTEGFAAFRQAVEQAVEQEDTEEVVTPESQDDKSAGVNTETPSSQIDYSKLIDEAVGKAVTKAVESVTAKLMSSMSEEDRGGVNLGDKENKGESEFDLTKLSKRDKYKVAAISQAMKLVR